MIRNYTTINITNESESIINITNENDKPINNTFNETTIIIIKDTNRRELQTSKGGKQSKIVSNIYTLILFLLHHKIKIKTAQRATRVC